MRCFHRPRISKSSCICAGRIDTTCLSRFTEPVNFKFSLVILLGFAGCFGSGVSGCVSAREEKINRANLHLEMGNALFERGSYHQALAEYLKSDAMYEANPQLHNNLGLTFFMQNRLDLAKKHLNRALELDAHLTDARNNLARVQIAEKDFAAAEASMKSVFEDMTYSHPERAYFTQGLLNFENARYGKAREAFFKSLQLDRGNCFTATYYARSMLELKALDEAAEAFDRAAGLCVKMQNDEAHYYGAVTQFRLGFKDKAITRFEELLKLYPEGKFRGKSRAMIDLIKKDYQ